MLPKNTVNLIFYAIHQQQELLFGSCILKMLLLSHQSVSELFLSDRLQHVLNLSGSFHDLHESAHPELRPE